MLYSDLKGRKLVDTTSADTVGKVDGFLLVQRQGRTGGEERG